jgi:uncharacterized protein (TIGR02117 family)
MKRFLLWISIPIVLLISISLIYSLAAFGLLFFPANAHQINANQTSSNIQSSTIDAYITSNGVHTDFIFPTRTSQVDWTTIFQTKDFPQTDIDTDFIAIGWGDREFYLNTPHWKDLTFNRAISAVAGQDRSAIHVEYLSHRDLQSMMRNHVYQLPLNQHQYARLQNYILNATVLKTSTMNKNTAQNIPNYHYDQNDAFFDARGQYSLLQTCNSWIGDGLYQAGIKVSRWTPFDITVYWYLKPTRIATH